MNFTFTTAGASAPPLAVRPADLPADCPDPWAGTSCCVPCGRIIDECLPAGCYRYGFVPDDPGKPVHWSADVEVLGSSGADAGCVASRRIAAPQRRCLDWTRPQDGTTGCGASCTIGYAGPVRGLVLLGMLALGLAALARDRSRRKNR